jgi:hypothetical protein
MIDFHEETKIKAVIYDALKQLPSSIRYRVVDEVLQRLTYERRTMAPENTK